MTTPSFTPGRFVWRELFTSDIEAAQGFYAAVCQWNIETGSIGGMDYKLIRSASTQVGGMMPLDIIPDEPRRSRWLGYVSVPDVDEATSAAASAGGQVVMAPRDTPPVGRMSVIRDPHGAVLALWRGHRGDDTALRGRPMAVGTFCWEQLCTTDVKSAADFYKRVVGWECAPCASSDGGTHAFRSPQGDMATLVRSHGDIPPHWMSFIVVESLSAAQKQSVKTNGRVVASETALLDIGRYAVIEDSTGAIVALFENTRP